jgi:ketosteroid isomerase-like protein
MYAFQGYLARVLKASEPVTAEPERARAMNWKCGIVGICMMLSAATAAAEPPDVDAIKTADDAFYSALSARDISRMMSVWADKPYILNIGPRSKAMNVGADEVRKYWEGAFQFFSHISVTKIDARIQTDGKLAWVVGMEDATLQPKDAAESLKFQTFVTHIFEKDGTRWRLVSHHAQMIPK